MIAEYFHQLQLEKEFRCLKDGENWKKFYVFLVQILSSLANNKQDQKNKINATEVLVPSWLLDVLQVCRLMYQAIGNLRIGICDGQHRMGAILDALFNWEIKANYRMPQDQLLNAFERLDKTPPSQDNLQGILKSLSEKVMVQVMVPPSISEFEQMSVNYSLARELSLIKNKPWVLPNV